MKHEIDRVVANLLLDEGEVFLPGVGTLILVRCAAKRLSSKELQRPYRELRLTGEERGVSLVKHIERIAGVTAERAEDIYNEYVAQSLREGQFTIEHLCTIEGGSVQTLQEFENMANPKGRGTIKINPHTNYFIYVVAVLCMLFALGVAGYVLYSNGAFDFDKSLSTRDVVAVESPVEVVEQQTEEVAQPLADTTAVAAVAEPVESAEVEVVSEPQILPLRRGMSYAVYGVYNELRNAEDAVVRLASRHPDIEAHIYDYDGRYMVALYELSQRSACGRKVSALKAERVGFKSVWVYTR